MPCDQFSLRDSRGDLLGTTTAPVRWRSSGARRRSANAPCGRSWTRSGSSSRTRRRRSTRSSKPMRCWRRLTRSPRGRAVRRAHGGTGRRRSSRGVSGSAGRCLTGWDGATGWRRHCRSRANATPLRASGSVRCRRRSAGHGDPRPSGETVRRVELPVTVEVRRPAATGGRRGVFGLPIRPHPQHPGEEHAAEQGLHQDRAEEACALPPSKRTWS